MPNTVPLLLADLGLGAEALREHEGLNESLVASIDAGRVGVIEFVRPSTEYPWVYQGPLRLTSAEFDKQMVTKDPASGEGRRKLSNLVMNSVGESCAKQGEPNWAQSFEFTDGHREGSDSVVSALVRIRTRRWRIETSDNGTKALVCGNYALQVTDAELQQLRALKTKGAVQQAIFDSLKTKEARSEFTTALGSGGMSSSENLDEIREAISH